MTVKERLKFYLKNKKISQGKFAESINVSSGYVNAIRKSIQPDKLTLIKNIYTDLNIDWLLTGDGEMLQYSNAIKNRQIEPNKEVDTVDYIEMNEDEAENEVIENSFGNRFEKLPNGEYLMYMPLFEWDVAASLLDNEGDTRHPDYVDIEQHVTVVKSPLKGKYSAFRIKGGSMEGTEVNRYVPDGSIVWGRELQRIHWKDKLKYNKFPLWVIASTDFGRPTLKEIIDHNVNTATITVDSWNPSSEYAHNVHVSLNTVKMLYYVMKVESSFSDVY
ncbi:helix-turn-helix domain-containing protein [Chryseobacterium defluvii]|uniref:Transcriptional regulator with XRE-family HTH domain n=1 Tax=Chryseobacterium defluvii TaxID=160396 RepID=A0A495SLY0_9FLAO|nr:helix-turn-helix transcriptional regulator [Chryseobacterium defluvii]RKT01047.1 transcriptional regulator with XRE-family HTH domain [Chryseobacterium defluvii]